MPLRKITMHWTVGDYEANPNELTKYHFLIEGDGKVVKGKLPPESNLPPLKDGKYVAHCGGGNTNNIGISLCGMVGYKGKNNPGEYPITQIQLEAACKLAAELCKKYGIKIDKAHVFTHYEFGLLNPDTTSAGKIDIDFLPWDHSVPANKVGDYIRTKVRWYLSKI